MNLADAMKSRVLAVSHTLQGCVSKRRGESGPI